MALVTMSELYYAQLGRLVSVEENISSRSEHMVATDNRKKGNDIKSRDMDIEWPNHLGVSTPSYAR